MQNDLTATDVLSSLLDLHGEEILTQFVICYETAEVDGKRNIGFLISPGSVDWNAVGILEWCKRMIVDNPE